MKTILMIIGVVVVVLILLILLIVAGLYIYYKCTPITKEMLDEIKNGGLPSRNRYSS